MKKIFLPLLSFTVLSSSLYGASGFASKQNAKLYVQQMADDLFRHLIDTKTKTDWYDGKYYIGNGNDISISQDISVVMDADGWMAGVQLVFTSEETHEYQNTSFGDTAVTEGLVYQYFLGKSFYFNDTNRMFIGARAGLEGAPYSKDELKKLEKGEIEEDDTTYGSVDFYMYYKFAILDSLKDILDTRIDFGLKSALGGLPNYGFKQSVSLAGITAIQELKGNDNIFLDTLALTTISYEHNELERFDGNIVESNIAFEIKDEFYARVEKGKLEYPSLEGLSVLSAQGDYTKIEFGLPIESSYESGYTYLGYSKSENLGNGFVLGGDSIKDDTTYHFLIHKNYILNDILQTHTDNWGVMFSMSGELDL
jgi:hypothetical protein